jgi:hypothetical protein
VINPVAETVATAVFVDDHVNVLPERTLPRESRATAVACIVLGTMILDESAVTLTLAVEPKREKLASRGLGLIELGLVESLASEHPRSAATMARATNARERERETGMSSPLRGVKFGGSTGVTRITEW